jgi:hypothetical protein
LLIFFIPYFSFLCGPPCLPVRSSPKVKTETLGPANGGTGAGRRSSVFSAFLFFCALSTLFLSSHALCDPERPNVVCEGVEGLLSLFLFNIFTHSTHPERTP